MWSLKRTGGWSHKPSSRLPLHSARPAVTFPAASDGQLTKEINQTVTKF